MGLDERKAKIIKLFEHLETNKKTPYFIADKFNISYRIAADLLNTMVAGDFLIRKQNPRTRQLVYFPTEYGLTSAQKYFEDHEPK